ncbi:hypothetical protein SLEP1_g2998 [Rubroshorea leprosula]|uniref:HTH myb-type domain-containing protein n=1 Tax=Rubroshorea leprosula TaxID=152421 RepID=A0AAV5HS87_9ROSI|nr:hypothetical protein SLEP1_g2998 [Rubroshorea leprosula]
MGKSCKLRWFNQLDLRIDVSFYRKRLGEADGSSQDL